MLPVPLGSGVAGIQLALTGVASILHSHPLPKSHAMPKPTEISRESALPNASHLSFHGSKAMEFGECSSSLASTSYDHIPGSEVSKANSHQSDNLHLPSKSFASASRSTRQRFFHQTTVVFLLSVWIGCLWGFMLRWPGRKDPRLRSPCNPRTWFTPSSMYGNFTLGQAKAVDVAWNVVVGRAAQAFIGYLFYKVLMDVSMRMMEFTTFPIDLFTSLVFEPFSFSSKVRIVNSLDRHSSPDRCDYWERRKPHKFSRHFQQCRGLRSFV